MTKKELTEQIQQQRVARTELAESGLIGATKPRIPQGSMRATCYDR